jgi:transcriptional regulator with XRE-family HTH domain
MARKQESDMTVTAAGRVEWLLRKIWFGSQTRMARDIGVSKSAVANILAGRRTPGRGFLLAVAAHPLINQTWLLSGEGEPLFVPMQAPIDPPSTATELVLPVADHFLPGPVAQFQDQLRGSYLPVARHDYRPTRYWLHLSSDELSDFGIGASDDLLVETDTRLITQLALPEWLCAVTVEAKAPPTLRQLKFDKTSGTLIDATPIAEARLARRESAPASRPEQRNLARLLPADPDDQNGANEPQASTKSEPTPAIPTATIPLDKVCGTVVLRQARWPWPQQSKDR